MSKDKNWVIYRDIKEQVAMERVLERYGLLDSLRPSGQNLVGCCPIHQGTNNRQFSVNLERNLYNCFGNCGSGGNVLDFVAKMEKVSIREAAILLKDWFPECGGQDRVPKAPQPTGKRVRKEGLPDRGREPQQARTEPQASTEAETHEAINPPLAFSLKNLDPEHQFLKDRAITRETAVFFGLGLCSRGLLKGRIAIPLHNERGELVAYCGRAVSAEQAEEEGKYKLPPKFVKTAVVYNLHRQPADPGVLILVESYLSVFALHQAGFPNVVALMGSTLSDEQADLISSRLGPDGLAVLFFDADDSGRTCTDNCLLKLVRRLFVKAMALPGEARKPHHLSAEALHALLGPVKSRA